MEINCSVCSCTLCLCMLKNYCVLRLLTEIMSTEHWSNSSLFTSVAVYVHHSEMNKDLVTSTCVTFDEIRYTEDAA